jgi:hypothetical protein
LLNNWNGRDNAIDRYNFYLYFCIFRNLFFKNINSKEKTMKIKLLLLSVFGAVAIANAQYTVTDDNGNVLQDGDVVEFGTLEQPEADYNFFVTNNNPTDEIYSRIEYLSQTNATNTDFAELCYGFQCYYGIELGSTTPPMHVEPMLIPVGHTTGLGNHLYSNDPGNGQGNVDFVFAFRQYEDAAGTILTGESLTFTYRYNPALSVNNVSKVNSSLVSTVVTDQLTMDVNEPVQVQVYDMQGKLVRQANFETGRQVMDVSNLSAQQYIVQFTNDGGAKKTSKVIVR